MNNDGSGCASYILGGVLLALVLAAVVAWTGLPTWDGSLAWDTQATADRQATERLRIEQENQTERLRIAESADTQRTWAIALASGVVLVSAIAGTVLIARTQAQRQPVTKIYQIPLHVVEVAARLPVSDNYVPEYEDGEWRLVSHVRGDWMTVDDAHRLTG